MIYRLESDKMKLTFAFQEADAAIGVGGPGTLERL